MKVVLRTCCVCKKKFNKNDMSRIVKIDDKLFLDNKKTMCGKATYICKDIQCKENLIKKKALNKAFKFNFNQEQYENLLKEI